MSFGWGSAEDIAVSSHSYMTQPHRNLAQQSRSVDCTRKNISIVSANGMRSFQHNVNLTFIIYQDPHEVSPRFLKLTRFDVFLLWLAECSLKCCGLLTWGYFRLKIIKAIQLIKRPHTWALVEETLTCAWTEETLFCDIKLTTVGWCMLSPLWNTWWRRIV